MTGRATLGCLLAVSLGLLAVSAAEDRQQGIGGQPLGSVSSIEPERAAQFAHHLVEAAQTIAANYYQEISETRLLYKAMAALHEAAQMPLPLPLKEEGEGYFKGRDPRMEIMRWRQSLGLPPVLRNHHDIKIGIRGMIDLLDPHTVYLSDLSMAMNATLSMGVRVGIHVEERPKSGGPWIIRQVDLDSPAEKAGLRPGDTILRVNQAPPTQNVSARQFQEELNGPIDTTLVLEVQSLDDAKPREVKVPRFLAERYWSVVGHRRVEEDWDYWLDAKAKIAFVRLLELFNGADSDMERLLGLLREEGMKGMILDLRDCPGGGLSEATYIAGMFLNPNLKVAEIRSGPKQLVLNNERFLSRSRPEEHRLTDFPMAVLIGPDTIGGGELIAAALQDHRRATLFGQRTHGKGTVQKPFSLMNHSLGQETVRLTSGLIYRPSGKTLQRQPQDALQGDWGVRPEPEHEIRVPLAIRRQIRLWRLQLDQRPADSNRLLALDKVENDPVLYWALEWLRKSLK